DGDGAHWATNDPPFASVAGLSSSDYLRNQQVPCIRWRGIILAFYYRCPRPGRGSRRRWSAVSEELSTAEAREIAREILRYLEQYPEAKDTLDGIAQWWIQGKGRKCLHRDVKRAVSWLCSQGLILETRRLGVPPYYQRNPWRRAAIAKLLK